jgi:hypothetical protein
MIGRILLSLAAFALAGFLLLVLRSLGRIRTGNQSVGIQRNL